MHEIILLRVSFNKSKLRVLWIESMSPNSLAKILINFSIAQWLRVPVLGQSTLILIPASLVTSNLMQVSSSRNVLVSSPVKWG